jgi:heme exporter protein B
MLSNALAIAGKDLRSELRTKETLNASLSFALVLLLLFSFAFDPNSDTVHEIAGGLLWLDFAFAAVLILNRGFSRELSNDCLDTLLSSPLTGAELFLGKCLGNFVLLLAVEAVCFPVFGLFYDITWTKQWPMLTLVVVLCTWGLTAVGTMFSAMTVNLRLRELMLPIILYPMMIPELMAAMQLTSILVAGNPLGPDDQLWVRLLVVSDVIFTLLAFALVEVVLVG